MNLREARFRQGKNQYDLTIETGIKQCRISLLERGYVEPTDRERKALLSALKIEKIDFDGIKGRKNE